MLDLPFVAPSAIRRDTQTLFGDEFLDGVAQRHSIPDENRKRLSMVLDFAATDYLQLVQSIWDRDDPVAARDQLTAVMNAADRLSETLRECEHTASWQFEIAQQDILLSKMTGRLAHRSWPHFGPEGSDEHQATPKEYAELAAWISLVARGTMNRLPDKRPRGPKVNTPLEHWLGRIVDFWQHDLQRKATFDKVGNTVATPFGGFSETLLGRFAPWEIKDLPLVTRKIIRG
ncbi:hypothetical protein [Parvularcula dongshanensis]|uniref:hypothetical protein n=1 Tax=Parvularcula dongshanensis TaxID=1173995 RepID=UPI001611C8DF|nr:hypothetical protein [Parvularcula dongshanensis]